MSEVRIPEGYKQTEVGVIPQNWETKNIGKDATLKARIGWQALTTNEYQSTGNYYLVTGTDFNAGEVQWDTCWYVDEWRYKQDLNIQLRIDDVLVTKDGTIGKVGYVDELPKPATLNSGVFVIRPKYNSFVPKYFFYVLTSSLFKEFIRNITAGSTITHLYQKDFVTFNFPVPPKKEQTAIATALSDVDNLIQSLDKLIAKKEAIKTGTMQQLLTGKTRLPEFATRENGSAKGFKQTELGRIPEDWEVSTLGDIANFLKGSGLPKSDLVDDGQYKCIHYGQLFTLYEELISKVKSSTNIDGNIKSISNDVLMPTSDVTPNGLATASCILEKDVVLGGDILIIRANPQILNGVYFAYLINIYREQVMRLVTGSTVYHLYGNTMSKLTINLPNAKEQTAIATILSDMDKEIQALQQRLEKTKGIKQGMMQQLLTGKVRLAH